MNLTGFGSLPATPNASTAVLNGLGGCGCTGVRRATDGTDGLGALGGADLFSSFTDNNFVDAVIGAGIGYMLAPRDADRQKFAAIGAVASGLLGTGGLMGSIAYALYHRK